MWHNGWKNSGKLGKIGKTRDFDQRWSGSAKGGAPPPFFRKLDKSLMLQLSCDILAPKQRQFKFKNISEFHTLKV